MNFLQPFDSRPQTVFPRRAMSRATIADHSRHTLEGSTLNLLVKGNSLAPRTNIRLDPSLQCQLTCES